MRLHWPEFGRARANVTTQTGAVPEGVPALLDVGGIKLLGAVLPGRSGLDGPEAWHGVWAQAPGWRSFLSDVNATYQSDAGINLSVVLRQLAKDCGETIAGLTERALGSWWARPYDVPEARYRGEDALALLVRGGYVAPWWVDALGFTRFDARPSSPIADAVGRVLERDRSGGWRLTGTDKAALFAPGNVFEGARIRRTIITEDAGELRVETFES